MHWRSPLNMRTEFSSSRRLLSNSLAPARSFAVPPLKWKPGKARRSPRFWPRLCLDLPVAPPISSPPTTILPNRDGQDLRDAYATLGLSVGIVVGGDTTAKRQDAYRADVVYISSKEVAFDYLRDGLMRSGNANNPNLAAKLSRVFTIAKVPHPPSVQRGLDVAIVDEIDSVLIDDAGTPLLISTNRTGEISEDVARTGLELANRYTSGSDFVLDAHDLIPSLTARGLRRLEDETAELSGPWRVRLIREELIRAAIASLHVLKRDHHYLVRDGKIVLIDPHSGRATPDRHWSHSLSLMVEVKEGCVSSGEKKSLASISFQRFFRGYATISGMSGTVREVAVELRAVYGLKPARIKRRLSLRRDYAQRRICSNRDELWAAAAQAAARLYAGGQPALVAVRSVGEANRASMALTTLGVPHRVLSAAQDAAEAEVVATRWGSWRHYRRHQYGWAWNRYSPRRWRCRTRGACSRHL